MVGLEPEGLSERRLVTGSSEHVRLRWCRSETRNELLHLGSAECADETVDDLAILYRHHRGNRLDLERPGDPRVVVHVHLDELDGSPGRIDDVLEYGTEAAARSAPR